MSENRAELPRPGEGETVGPYRLLDVLGRGAMGVVWSATHVRTGERVALKRVAAPGEAVAASIRREIRALRGLRHPGVVSIADDGVEGGMPWYAMELVRGRTLRASMPSAKSLGSDGIAEVALIEALNRIRFVCNTLSFVHGHGVVHHDLKPENVMLRREGLPVLMDFGLARRFVGWAGREALEIGAGVEGSDAYIAPEQLRGGEVDARADVYATGCILFEHVTGRPPFVRTFEQSVRYQHLHAAPPRAGALVRGVPPELDRLLEGLLAKRAEDRIGYASDVAAALVKLGATAADPVLLPAAEAYLYRARLSGRDGALRAIEPALDALVAGRGGVILIGGESGVGKTRLAAEVGTLAAWRGVEVVTGECSPVGADRGPQKGEPLHAFRQLLTAVADRCRTNPATTRELWELARALAPYEPSLSVAQGRAPGELPALPPRAARARVLRAVRDVLFAFAAERPVLLVLDDLQWADELSLDALGEIARGGIEEHGVLMIGTHRADEVSAAELGLASLSAAGAPGEATDGGRAPPGHLLLGRLDAAGVRAVAGGMLALGEAPRALGDALYERSSGNPFFLGEYLRAAIGARLLTRSAAGEWQWGPLLDHPEALDASPAPRRSLAALVRRRLLALDGVERALAQLSSVLGREMDAALLLGIAGLTEEAAMDALEVLRVRQILEEPSPGRLRFVHGVLREVAYAELDAGEVAALHRRVAEALEQRDARALAARPDPALLGHHWSHAGVPDRAARAFAEAAERARAAHAGGDAVGLYRAALREAGESERLGRAIEGIERLHEGLGDALSLSGRQEEARSSYSCALAQIGDRRLIERARLRRKLGKTHESHHEHAEAVAHYRAAEDLLGEPVDGAQPVFWPEWIRLQIDRMAVHYWLSEVSVLAARIERAGPLVEAHGSAKERASFLGAVTQMRVRRERYAVSTDTVLCAREALAAAEASGDAAEIAEHRSSLGITLLLRGDLGEAESQLTDTLAACERMGYAHVQVVALAFLTMLQRRRRRQDETRHLAMRCLRAARAGDLAYYVAAARAHLSWIACVEGRAGDAESEAERALDLWRALSTVQPFQWTARIVLCAVEVPRDGLDRFAAQARAMLDHGQSALPEPVESALADTVEQVGRGDLPLARSSAARALDAARAHGLL
ncbi:MAG: AAA family ATPase [Polyangiaceae bacterium]